MNISSVVVFFNMDKEERIKAEIEGIENCEMHLNTGDGRLIVTLEGQSVDDEVRMLGQLKKIDGVISADMIFAYAEDELNAERDKLQGNPKIPDWLNDDNVDLSDIRYNGDLKRRF